MKKEKLVRLCPVCSRAEGKLITPEEYVELRKKNWIVTGKRMCKECKKIIKESVNFFCKWKHYETGHLCETFMSLTLEKAQEYMPDVKLGEIYDIQACTKCSKDRKFKFI